MLDPQKTHDRMIRHLWALSQNDPQDFLDSLEAVSADWSAFDRKCFFLNTGVTLHEMGLNELARETATKARQLAEAAGDLEGQAKACVNLGIYNTALREFLRAGTFLDRSLALSKRIGDISNESKCYVGLGRLCNEQHDFETGRSYFERALELKDRLGDVLGQAKCHMGLGLALHGTGDFRGAILEFENVLRKTPPRDFRDRAAATMNKSLSLLNLGRFREALDFQREAETLAAKSNDAGTQAAVFCNLGIIYGSIGDYQQAIEYNTRALSFSTSSLETASFYQNIANGYFNLRDYPLAIRYFQNALEVKQQFQEWRGSALCLMNLGNCYGSSHEFDRALKYHTDALNTVQEHPEPFIEGQCYFNLGSTYVNMGDIKKGMFHYHKGLTLAEELGSSDLMSKGHAHLAQVEHVAGDVAAAHAHCQTALRLGEVTGSALIEDGNRLAFAGTQTTVLDVLISTCIDLKGPGEAWRELEKSKARALSELLRTAQLAPTIAHTDHLETLLAQESNLLRQIRAIQISQLSIGSSSPKPGQVKALLDELDQVYNELEQHDPDYTAIRRGYECSSMGVSDAIRCSEGTILVEYFLSPDRIYAFAIVDRKAVPDYTVIPIERDRVETTVARYLDVAAKAGSSEQQEQEARSELDSWLIEPLSEYFRKANHIVFVPTRRLHYLPLHALHLDGQPLINRCPVSYSPSASILPVLLRNRQRPLESVASFGVDNVQEEAARVAALFGNQPYLGPKATVDRFLASCGHCDILHLSCHGAFNRSDALSSGFQLYDGFVTARDLFGLRINADLVTLSACETGMSETTLGDDIVGLTRAFLYAGATSVLATLWKVDIETTKQLIERFYLFLRQGNTRAKAIQLAQKEIMKTHGRAYYWSPFVLTGNW